jgi:cytochrome c peroxidase
MKVSTVPRLLVCSFPLLLSACSVTASNSATATTSTTATSTAIANLQPFADSTGTVSTYTSAGSIDTAGVFFQTLGTNGRTCATCHQPAQGMSLNAATVAALFASSNGTDPLFTAVDGANCPTVATGNAAGHSLIVNNGLVRIAVTVPAGAQFTLSVVQDPYGCALTTNAAGGQVVSVYRRPLPTASLPFLSSVMWDTRQTSAALATASTLAANLNADLTAQALDAVATHMQGSTIPTTAQLSALLAFEQGLFTAQNTDSAAGSLLANGATGGAANLAAVNYYPGINDAFGGDPKGAAFTPNVFSIFQAWTNSTNAAQASIANGERLFNTAPLTISNFRGINDNTALGSPNALQASCSTCHDAPSLGHHSVALPLDTAVSRLAQFETSPDILGGVAQLSAPSLPVYLISGCTGTNGKPVLYYTSDPGKALTTGLCADVNRMKVPGLRGLAARAPYFHNGSAANLTQVVNFYNARFQMKLNPQQVTDLVNFLNAL